MKNNDDFNPFLLNGYHSPELFCDRKEETSLLINNALNGVNTTLLSIRRMGKTGVRRKSWGADQKNFNFIAPDGA